MRQRFRCRRKGPPRCALTGQFSGERNATVMDPAGHRPMILETIRPVSPAEMQQRQKAATGL